MAAPPRIPAGTRGRAVARARTRLGGGWGIRTGKTVLAAMVAYLVALAVSPDPAPVLASLTALLVVQVTLYESLTSGLQRVVAVVLGVLVAVGVSRLFDLHWWSLGLVVALGILVGRLLRLGDALVEVPISAMLILAIGGREASAFARVWETLIGAAVGVAVHVVIAPPLYVRPAGQAVQDVADDMADLLDAVAGEVPSGYDLDRALGWLERSRRLGRSLDRADAALDRAQASLHLNPRALPVSARATRLATTGDTLRTGLDALERTSVSLRGAFRALADRARGPNAETVYAQDVRVALGTLCGHVARAVRAFGSEVNNEVRTPRADDRDLRLHLERAWRARDELARRLHDGERPHAAGWELHGALLSHVDRMLREIDAEGRRHVRESLRRAAPEPITLPALQAALTPSMPAALKPAALRPALTPGLVGRLRRRVLRRRGPRRR